MSDAPVSNVPTRRAKERYSDSRATREETLVYLSRYLFWLVMAVLLGVFSLIV